MTRHRTIREILGNEIGNGTYPVGALLPTEHALCRRFGASRHTIREALRVLQQQGLLERRAGAGTTVLARTPHDPQSAERADWIFELRHQGGVTAREGLAALLDCAPGERWMRFAGVRRGAAEPPLCWTEIFVAERYGRLRDAGFDASLAIGEQLRRVFGVTIRRSEQTIRAAAMPADIASALRSAAGSPALTIRVRHFAEGSQPCAITLTLYPGDRYAHTAQMTAKC